MPILYLTLYTSIGAACSENLHRPRFLKDKIRVSYGVIIMSKPVNIFK